MVFFHVIDDYHISLRSLFQCVLGTAGNVPLKDK